MQRTYRFRDGKKLILSGRTLVMGILNVTPDSFSDGGKWNTRDRALRHMEEMARVAAEVDVPVVVMHNQNGTVYNGDIITAMRTFFSRSLAIADAAGLARENIILDPGIGFGKTAEQNLQVIKRMDELVSYEGADYPVLLGASRKSFIGAALGLPVEERMEATGAACVLGIARGACIMRVHDVKPIVRMCRMADAILGA